MNCEFRARRRGGVDEMAVEFDHVGFGECLDLGCIMVDYLLH